MELKSDEVVDAVFRAVETMNRGLPKDKQLHKSADTVLFGRQGALDSMGLVDLVLLTEQQIAKEFGRSITLADQRAMSRENSPFRTIRTLSEYILELLNE
jgi:acyl carrier protein